MVAAAEPCTLRQLRGHAFAAALSGCHQPAWLTPGAARCLPLQEVIVSERRFKYEEEVKRAPLNYDAWFDYIRLEESAGDVDRTREVRRYKTGGGTLL
jgi:hypothetical protein